MAEADLRAKELREIQARCEKATTGPWSNGVRKSQNGLTGDEHMGKVCAMRTNEAGLRVGEVVAATWDHRYSIVYVGLSRQQTIDNAEFIAHARQDIPYLLGEIERLSAALAAVQQESQKEISILKLAVPLEEELSNRIDEMLKYLAMEQGFTLAGIARLLSDVQRRMAADWIEVGNLRREIKALSAPKAPRPEALNPERLADIQYQLAHHYNGTLTIQQAGDIAWLLDQVDQDGAELRQEPRPEATRSASSQQLKDFKTILRPWMEGAGHLPGTVTYADWEAACERVFGPINPPPGGLVDHLQGSDRESK